MKIGILAYRQYPYISANTAIAYAIGDHVDNHDVIYIGRRQDICQFDVKEYNCKKIRFLNKKVKPNNSRLSNIIRRMVGDEIFFSLDARGLKKIVDEENIDALICVIAPNDNASIIMAAHLNIPVYIYQLDPFYNSYDQINEQLKKKFLKLISRTEHLFTTDLLYSEYIKDSEISLFKYKISVVQFPKLIKPNVKNNLVFEGEKIKLLYAGTLYHKIRDPKILVKLKNRLPKNYEIIFCGSCDVLEDLQILKDAGIICKGYCSQEALEHEMESADILVNIGNQVKNQLGSKIIDYIALGKPILNIVQFEECPTIDVLKKYKLKFNISISDLKNEQIEKEMVRNLEQMYGKNIAFSEIVKSYVEYTPQFVTKQLLEKIIN